MSTHLVITTFKSIEDGVEQVADLGLIEHQDFSEAKSIYKEHDFCEYLAVPEYFEGQEVPTIIRIANNRNPLNAESESSEKHIEEVLFKLPDNDVLSGCTVIGYSNAVKVMQLALLNVCKRLGVYVSITAIDFGPEPVPVADKKEKSDTKPVAGKKKKSNTKPVAGKKKKSNTKPVADDEAVGYSEYVENRAAELGLVSEEEKLSLSVLIDTTLQQIASDNYVPFKCVHNIDKLKESMDLSSLKTEAVVEVDMLLLMLADDINNINNINVDSIDKLIIVKTCLEFLSKSSKDEHDKMLKALKAVDNNLALAVVNFEKYNTTSILDIPKAELPAARLASATTVRVETMYGMASYLKAI